MKPEIWGPHAWIFLHSITLAYPEIPTQQDKINMRNFINSLGEVLPCNKCKINFKSHLKTNPLTDKILSSRNSLIKWMIDIHNSVNKSNFKETLSYENSLKYILNLYEDNNFIMIVFSIIIVISIFVILFNIFAK